MSINKTQSSFSGGIISTEMMGRIDYEKLQTGVKECENFLIRPVGGIQYVAGTTFLDKLSEPTKYKRLIPFIENKDKAYCLLFEDKKISVYNETGLITQFTSNVPYLEADLAELRYAQYKNRLYIAHQNYAPAYIEHTSSNTWVSQSMNFNGSILSSSYIQSISIAKGSAPTPYVPYNKWQYAVSVVDSEGNESMAVASSVEEADIALSQQGFTVTATLQGNYGTDLEYVYFYRVQGGVFYFCQKLPVVAGQATYSFTDRGVTLDTTKSTKIAFNDFYIGNYPRCVAFFNQRLIFGGTQERPNDIWGSNVGRFDDFSHTINNLSSEAFNLTLASGTLDEIEHIIPLDSLIVFSSGKIWRIDGTSASNMQATIESYSSISDLAPCATKKSILYVDASLNTISNFVYSYELNGYVGQNLDILARELFDGYRFVAQSFRTNPFPVYFAIREDGVMMALTYLREENIYAWSKMTTQGKYLDVCCLSSQINDKIFVLTKRDGEVYLELFADQISAVQDVDSSCYLHNSKIITNNSSDTITGLTWLANKDVNVVADKHVYKNQKVDENGELTISGLKDYSRVVVGLPYKGVLQTIPQETVNATTGSSTLGLARKICNATIMVYKTRGITWGTSLDKTTLLKPYTEVTFGETIPLETGKFNLPVSSSWDKDTSFFFIQEYPLPCFLQNITLEIEYGSKN